jgi:hypothetical protein
MCHVQRYALDAQPLEARLDLPSDAATRKPAILALAHRVERLRLDRDRVANLRALPGEPLADPRLAPSTSVRIRGVERRDAEVPRGIHDPPRFVARDALPEEGGR